MSYLSDLAKLHGPANVAIDVLIPVERGQVAIPFHPVDMVVETSELQYVRFPIAARSYPSLLDDYKVQLELGLLPTGELLSLGWFYVSDMDQLIRNGHARAIVSFGQDDIH